MTRRTLTDPKELARVGCYSCYTAQHEGAAYMICGECFHVYRTRWHLLVARYAKAWKLERWSLLGIRHYLPSRIWVCPCCSHDL